MRYPNIHRATFIERPNRFVARCLLEGEPITVHVKNPGRCRELLVPGAEVWLTKSDNPARKTAFDLIAVQKGTRLINMDSNAPIPPLVSMPGRENSCSMPRISVPRCAGGIPGSIFVWKVAGKPILLR